MKRSLGLISLFLGLVLFAAPPATLAAVYNYYASLSGPNEFPPNASPGTGFGKFVYTDTAHTLDVAFNFKNLNGLTTASHIHAATPVPLDNTAGVATTTPTFAGFPLNVTSGTYHNNLDLTLASSWNPAYITAHGGTTAGAETDFIAAIRARKAYLNIHTAAPNGVPGGEIRGFLIPEPSTFALFAFGSAACACIRRRRRA